MARVTMIFEDSPDGVEVSFEFDPEVTDEDSLTEAQAFALATIEWMQETHEMQEDQEAC